MVIIFLLYYNCVEMFYILIEDLLFVELLLILIFLCFRFIFLRGKIRIEVF